SSWEPWEKLQGGPSAWPRTLILTVPPLRKQEKQGNPGGASDSCHHYAAGWPLAHSVGHRAATRNPPSCWTAVCRSCKMGSIRHFFLMRRASETSTLPSSGSLQEVLAMWRVPWLSPRRRGGVRAKSVPKAWLGQPRLRLEAFEDRLLPATISGVVFGDLNA